MPTSLVIEYDPPKRVLQEQLMGGRHRWDQGLRPQSASRRSTRPSRALLERHLHLGLGAETGDARFRTGAYGFWRLHVLALLRDAAGARDLPGATAPRPLPPHQITASLTWLSRLLDT